MPGRTFVVLKALLAVVAVAFLVSYVDARQIAAAAATARPGWIVAAVALLPLGALFTNEAWYLVVRHIAPEATRRAAFESLLCGFALGFFTPARAGDMAGRAFYLPYGDKWSLGAGVYLQRLSSMATALGVGLIAFVGFVLRFDLVPAALWWGFALYGAVALASLAVLFLAPGRVYALLERLMPGRAAVGKVGFIRRIPRPAMLRLLALGALQYATFTTQFVLLLQAFRPEPAALTAYPGLAALYFGKYLIPSITMMDLGVREGMAVFFLGRLGFDHAAAFNSAFLLFCINLLLPAALGIPFVLRMRGLRKHDAETRGRGDAEKESERVGKRVNAVPNGQ